MKKIIVFYFFLLAVVNGLHAQSGMKVAEVFDGTSFGKERKEIIIKGKELKPYHLTLFRSQTLETTPEQREAIESLVKADGKDAADKEVGTIGGRIYYAFYCFAGKDNQFTYLFYRNNTLRNKETQEITLVYMEGRATLDQLKKMFH